MAVNGTSRGLRQSTAPGPAVLPKYPAAANALLACVEGEVFCLGTLIMRLGLVKGPSAHPDGKVLADLTSGLREGSIAHGFPNSWKAIPCFLAFKPLPPPQNWS